MPTSWEKVCPRLIKIYLHHYHPIYIRADVEYDNPHFLKLPGAPALTLEALPLRVTQPPGQSHELGDRAVNVAIEEIFESISKNVIITAASYDPHVKWNLFQ